MVKTKVKTDHLLSPTVYDLVERMEAILELHLKSGHKIVGTNIVTSRAYMGDGTPGDDWQYNGYIFYSVKA